MKNLTKITIVTAISSSRVFIYRCLGLIFVVLAFIGVILPLVPTTPFLLLAAMCFSRSSRRCHEWLHNNRLFGPIIKNWEENKSVTPMTKIIAITSIFLFGGYTMFFVLNNPYVRVFGALIITTGLVTILKLKTATSD